MRICSAFVFSLILFSTTAYSQDVLKSLVHYNNNYPQEKMHVHFDKAVYVPGETIWFKAYLQTGLFPSSASTNFYAQLLDDKGNVIANKRYPVIGSTATGNFDIPASMKSSVVMFRGFTGWGSNFDSSFIYAKAFSLARAQSTQKTNTTTELRFFPEGGELVKNVESVIAFKAEYSDGTPIDVKGTIKDKSGRTIMNFSSVHNGMGKLKFTPDGSAYYAEWKDPAGITKRVALPAAKENGIVLQMEPGEKYIPYIIRKSDSNDEAQKKVHVIAQMHQQLVYMAHISLDNVTTTSGIIPADSLTTGILQVTVFDNNWKPVNERILFVDKNDYWFSARFNQPEKKLTKRGRNTIEISVPDTLKKSLSISITDALLPEDDESIFTKLLLTSELRGYVYKPSYYFSGSSDSIPQQLDLVMLTNGWRKYNWELLSAGIMPVIKDTDQHFLSLKGEVYGLPASELSRSSQLNLIIQAKDSTQEIFSTTLDKNGRFKENNMIFFDSVSVFYQFNKNARYNDIATVKMGIESKKIPSLYSLDSAFLAKSIAGQTSSNRQKLFAQKLAEVLPAIEKQNKQLDEVFVRSVRKTREQELEKKYVSGLFSGDNARTFNLIDDRSAVGMRNIFDYLRGRVAGLLIQGSGLKYQIIRRNYAPALFLNEMPVDANQLLGIAITDIALVKVFDPPFIGVPGGGPGGAIAVYTKKGTDEDKTAIKGLSKSRMMGYDVLKQFYSPDYARASPLHEIEDVRSTIYWNPHVNMDKANKHFRVQLYNNDVSTQWRVVIEGMNENGQLTRIEKIIR